ncbi:MAG TPA: hypothetical protein VJJ52_03320 [Candidatus Nanoarchaeia archaeon]|nr:hypothetical protein [Candidatus Nanoarchaeia archaeon]
MAELVDLIDKLKKYYTFTKYEVRGYAIAILAIAFIISFREWGANQFDLAAGLFNLFNSILIVAMSVLVHDAGQRIWGLAIGYKIEFKMWTFGVVLGLILAFVTNGKFWLIIPGTFMLHHLAGHRLGFFRYGINIIGQSMVALAGPLFTLMLIILLKILYALSPNPLLQKAIMFNIIYNITNMLPIPVLDGGKIFFGSRMIYAFVMPAMIVATILMMIDIPVFFSVVLSLLVGVILWLWYYVSFERKVWKGP